MTRNQDPARAPHRLLFGAAALAVAVAGCASAGGMEGAAAQDVTGCYLFVADEAAAAMRLPQGIRLTDQALTGWPAIMQRGGVKVAVTLTRTGEADYPFGYWLVEDDGTLEVGYPAGGGIVMDLEAGRDTLEGTARAVGDTWSFGEDEGVREIEVQLERATCPM